MNWRNPSSRTRNEGRSPHHSSLFFGCDRVNVVNYWQEGLERGRIVSWEVKPIRASSGEVTIEQRCRWERPGAEGIDKGQGLPGEPL